MDDLFSRLGSAIGRKMRRADNAAPVPYGDSSSALFNLSGGDAQSVGDRAYAAYGSVGTLFAIVSQIGNAFASTEWHLYRRTSVRDKKRRTEVLNHGFMTVWDKPNPFYTGRFFRETVQQHLDLVGEGVIVLYKVGGIVIEMWPVRPDRIVPVRSTGAS